MVWQPPKDKAVYNLDVAYGIIREKLARVDIKRQCTNSGAELQPDGSVSVRYLNEIYRINVQTADVSLIQDSRKLSLRDKILILHYFVQASGVEAAHRQITYRDLPGGLVYYPTFTKRTIQPLVDTFGDRPPLLLKAGERLGARSAGIGDSSLLVEAFPRVAIIIILWRGDGELPPGANLLFDAGISNYLESEDVTVVCETLTWRLINIAQGL